MSERMQVFKCDACGEMVVVLHGSGCEPACCGKPMQRLAENSVDAAKEKHVPVVERTADGFRVAVGSVPHPMESDHFIEWIELYARSGEDAGLCCRKFLNPGEKPEARFSLRAKEVSVREYCNKHGLWRA